ncbi:MAG: sigma-70 family RNA polymerase sigma factor [Roseburia sp.]|nr:sigma-70 family RNA polymerase sigma factor [Roseburia sp.]
MKALVRRAQRGNADSFIRLIEENKQTLMRVAYGFFQNEEDVADAMQETIADAYEHLGELKKPEYFKTWLTKILINNCSRIYNQNRRTAGIDQIPEEGVMSSGIADVEFQEMIASLPREDRAIFQLYYGENFTTREIAQMLQKKESTVKSRLHRGKEKLRSQIKLIC